MPIEITMPRLSDTMEEGTLIKWRVKVGDKVTSGDVLGDIETDKATMELEAYDDGTVAQLAVNEGDTTPIGQLIIVLAEEGESVEEVLAKTPAMTQANTEVSKDGAMVPSEKKNIAMAPGPPQPPSSDRLRASPVARKIAEEHALDLNAIEGTGGPEGRIIKRDVLAALDQPDPAGPEPDASSPPVPVTSESSSAEDTESEPVSNMRKTIARRLVESKTTIPHWTVSMGLNMDPLLELRATLNDQLKIHGTVKLSVNDFMVRACGLALQQHPAINASWEGDTIRQYSAINVGVAVALPVDMGGGLVVPTIYDAAKTSLSQISTETKRLAKKAREQGLTPEEMSEGTFTVSNLGMFGIEHFEAIINPPQAAILAVGAAIEKPVVRDGQIRVGHEMTCTLSADHRVIDGAMGAEFLQTLKQLLENPAVMLVS